MEFLNLLRRISFIRIIIPLLLGTLFGFQWAVNAIFVFIVVVILIVFLIFILPFFKAYWWRGIFLFIAWFSLGFLNTQFSRLPSFNLFEKNASVVASVADEVDFSKKNLRIKVKLIQINDRLINKRGWNLLLIIHNDSSLRNLNYGDRLFFRADIDEIENLGNPNEFDYKNYLYRKNVVAQSFVDKNNLIFLKGFSGSIIKKWALATRMYLLKRYIKNGIVEQNLAVLSALSLGYKDDLSGETKKSFSSTGAMHILAVSGLHVGILYMLMNFILRFLEGERTKWIRLFLILFAIWSFALISGSSPSVLRASLMFSLVAIGLSLNRVTNLYNNILLSAFFLILIQPKIVFEVGFQLSYLAVFFIVWLVPIMQSWIKSKNKALNWVWTMLAVSLAAQLGTGPIALYYFHQFPNYFLLTNIVVVPFASYLMGASIVFFVFSGIPGLGLILGKLLNFSVSVLIYFVQFIEKLPFSSTKFIDFSNWDVILFYVLIISVFAFVVKKYYYLLRWSLFVLFVIFLLNFGQKWITVDDNKFIIYNSPNSSNYQFLDLFHNQVFCSIADSSKWNYVATMFNNSAMDFSAPIIDYTMSDFKNENLPSGLRRAGNYRIFFIHSDELEYKTTEHLLNVDYIVLNNHSVISIDRIKHLFQFKKIIIDSSVSFYKRQKWLSDASNLAVEVYDLKKEGAFVLSY